MGKSNWHDFVEVKRREFPDGGLRIRWRKCGRHVVTSWDPRTKKFTAQTCRPDGKTDPSPRWVESWESDNPPTDADHAGFGERNLDWRISLREQQKEDRKSARQQIHNARSCGSSHK